MCGREEDRETGIVVNTKIECKYFWSRFDLIWLLDP